MTTIPQQRETFLPRIESYEGSASGSCMTRYRHQHTVPLRRLVMDEHAHPRAPLKRSEKALGHLMHASSCFPQLASINQIGLQAIPPQRRPTLAIESSSSLSGAPGLAACPPSSRPPPPSHICASVTEQPLSAECTSAERTRRLSPAGRTGRWLHRGLSHVRALAPRARIFANSRWPPPLRARSPRPQAPCRRRRACFRIRFRRFRPSPFRRSGCSGPTRSSTLRNFLSRAARRFRTGERSCRESPPCSESSRTGWA